MAHRAARNKDVLNSPCGGYQNSDKLEGCGSILGLLHKRVLEFQADVAAGVRSLKPASQAVENDRKPFSEWESGVKNHNKINNLQ